MKSSNFLLFTLAIWLAGSAWSQSQNAINVTPFISSDPVLNLSEWDAVIDGASPTQKITLPYIADAEIKSLSLQTSFSIPDSLKDKNLELHVSGIQGFARIILNKNLVLTHPDYPSPFSLNIPAEWIKTNGVNFLEISIAQPQKISEGYPNYVYVLNQSHPLSVTGAIYITWPKDVHYKSVRYNYQNKELNLNYTLVLQKSDTLRNGAFRKMRFEELVTTYDGKIVFKRFEYIDYRRQHRKISRKIAIKNPQLWSPDSPDLYIVQLSAHAEGKRLAHYEQKMGLRSIQVLRGQILLNHEPITITGINYRPLYAESGISRTTLHDDLVHIKELGFNAVRLPNCNYWLDLFTIADSIGLLLSFDNGIWRIPEDYFLRDDIMQMTKQFAREIIPAASRHPSFFSLGLGTEISLHDSGVEKFVLILNKYLKQDHNVTTHVSPLDYTRVPSTKLADIYLINTYGPGIFSAIKYYQTYSQPLGAAVLLGNPGFAAGHDSVTQQFKAVFSRLRSAPMINGFFIESYRDWPGAYNSTLRNADGYYPYGLLSHTGERRPHYDEMRRMISGKVPASYLPVLPANDTTNFFSLSIFICSIIFFLLYRQSFRLRDNIKRSLSHSYGFFVDLRDRRIIALLNSFIIGLFTNLIISNIIAAYLYFYRDSIYLEEIMSSVLSPFGLQGIYFDLVESPFLLLLVIWGFFFSGQIIIAALLKLINIFSDEKIRFRQTVAVCNWAGVPLLTLLPVSLISFQIILPMEELHIFLLIAMVLSFIWYNFRLANGIRVLMILPAFKVFSILVLTYSIVFVTLLVFLETDTDFIGYFNLLTQGRVLFY